VSDHVLFLIEGGQALKLAKKHYADVQRTRREAIGLVKELDPEARYRVSDDDGRVTAIMFSGKRHPDFTLPNKFGSRPKKGTPSADKWKAQAGHESPSTVISKAFKVPLSIGYGEGGWRHIGYPLRECGFLYLGAKGPFAMWVPDVPTIVAEYEDKGQAVKEPAKSFKLEFDGCRRIEQEEWDIIVAQNKLAQKRKEKNHD
jgi:hypothetical protein